MATHDYVIANASGAAVRQDINNALAAIVSNNSSATEPGTTYAFQFWFDTTNNILKIRNAANSAWIDWITTTATVLLPDGAVGSPSLTFASETDTGLYRIAANKLGIATSGTERVEISDTGIIVNEGGAAAIDVRIEGDSEANLVFIDAGNDRVGIATASPDDYLTIADTSTSGDVGLRFKGDASSRQFIMFGDPGGAQLGDIMYDHGTNELRFRANNSERLRVDSAGRLLVGTTSNIGAGADNRDTIVGVATAGAGLILGRNDTAVSAGNDIGKIQFWGNDSNGTYEQCASIKAEADLGHATGDKPTRLVFSTTADGASSPTERLFLLSNGRLGVGISSPDFTLDVNGGVGITEGQALQWHNGSGSNSAQIYGDSSNNLIFRNTSSNTERLRIDGSGQVHIGGQTSATSVLGNGVSIKSNAVGSDYNTGALALSGTGGDFYGLTFAKTLSSTAEGFGFLAAFSGSTDVLQLGYNSGSSNQTILSCYQNGNVAAVGNVTAGNGTEAAPAFSFSGDPDGGMFRPAVNTIAFSTLGTERCRLASSGQLLVGTTSTDMINATTGGGCVLSDGGGDFAADNQVVGNFNRTNGDDAAVITIRHDGDLEGSITVNGSTVSFNGGHLTRWSQLEGGAERTEILRGSVLSNLDEMCVWSHAAVDEVLYTAEDELPEGVQVGDVKIAGRAAYTEDNDQLNRLKISDVEGDPNVAGVFQMWDNDDDTYTNDFYVAMTGDFVIRIAQGTTVARGDLLMSAGDGTAKPQDDDIVRSKTIAKVTSTVVSTTYADGSYCVPCVLMAC